MGEVPKQYRLLDGRAVVAHSVAAFEVHPRFGTIIVVAPPGDTARMKQVLAGRAVQVVEGGATRAASVRAGVAAIGDEMALAFVHDAARPGLDQGMLDLLLQALEGAPAACPALPVTDSLRRVRNAQIHERVDRDGAMAVQTPQAFRTAVLRSLLATDQEAEDETALAIAAGVEVCTVPGSPRLIKLTHPSDLELWRAMHSSREVRTGSGFDVHRLVPGTGLRLCGITIECDFAFEGHSDADVGLHALTDALLGAMAEGDIGQHFPPSDPQWRGADSALFVRHAAGMLESRGGRLVNADLTIICERPKIGPHRAAMQRRVAEIMGVDPGRVSVKATTTEGLGFTGRGEGLAVMASVSIELPGGQFMP